MVGSVVRGRANGAPPARSIPVETWPPRTGSRPTFVGWAVFAPAAPAHSKASIEVSFSVIPIVVASLRALSEPEQSQRSGRPAFIDPHLALIHIRARRAPPGVPMQAMPAPADRATELTAEPQKSLVTFRQTRSPRNDLRKLRVRAGPDHARGWPTARAVPTRWNVCQLGLGVVAVRSSASRVPPGRSSRRTT